MLQFAFLQNFSVKKVSFVTKNFNEKVFFNKKKILVKKGVSEKRFFWSKIVFMNKFCGQIFVC